MRNFFKKYSKYSDNFLRMLSVVLIVVIVLLFISAYLISKPGYQSIGLQVENGYLDIGSSSLENSPPIYLSGDWEYYPGVYFKKNGYNQDKLKPTQYVNFPVTDCLQARQSETYRMFINLQNTTDTELVLYIPTPQNNINVFVNGQLLTASKTNENWLNYSEYDSLFKITNIDRTLEYQEIVLSTDGSNGSLGVYRRDIVISTIRNILTLAMVSISSELLIVGMIFIMLVNGYIFMMFRPNHKMITAMTIFDSLLMLRILFGLNYFFAFINNTIGDVVVNDRLAAGLKIFFLFLSGLAGMRLSHNLYDPEGKAPKILIVPPALIFVACSLYFPWNFTQFNKYGIPILIVTLAYTFIGVICQFVICIKKKFSWYYVLQVIKTGFVGIVICIDIFNWNSTTMFPIIVLLYCLFFITHLGFRLYDNNTSYKQVEMLNRNLETTVNERTKELEQANKLLRELAIHDPLTKCFNRLYFERTYESLLSQYKNANNSFYLIMFDLDKFKNVNDTYGHDEGDRQLIEVVNKYNEIALENSVLARVGGEEFTILLHDYSDEDVLKWADNFRSKFETAKNTNSKNATISVGITKQLSYKTGQQLFKAADICLYNAKNTGRNKICFDFDGEVKTYLP